jgi:hypothetical protein
MSLMTGSKLSAASASSSESLGGRAGRLLRRPRGLIGLAIVLIVVGAAFNWSWLVAAGVAPIILATAPCLVMCALGLCMVNMGRRDSAGASTGLTLDSAESAASLRSDQASCSSSLGASHPGLVDADALRRRIAPAGVEDQRR